MMWSMEEEYLSQTGSFRESFLEQMTDLLSLGQLGLCEVMMTEERHSSDGLC